MTDRQSTGPRIATYRHDLPPGATTSSAAARHEGRLAVIDNCLVTTGSSIVQPVFPAGSVNWDERAQSLIYKGTAYRIGSRIELGGGGVGDEAAYAARTGVSIPRCGAARLFVVGP
ncbi:MAG TPA: hypothetical protein VEZ70_11310 [Allosphingosinicella sp.]|nr:hypothetical protein [Allosphingosinicella sp.]